MSNVSLYNDMIKYLDKCYQDSKTANAANKVLLAIDDASVMITLAKTCGEDRTMAAVRRLMAAGLIEEADHIFNMWWEA